MADLFCGGAGVAILQHGHKSPGIEQSRVIIDTESWNREAITMALV